MKRELLFLLILSFTQILYAQNQKRFRHIDINNGLSHTDATCFVQDDNGYMWIGTNRGINRYDGYEVQTFINPSPAAQWVFDNRISALSKQGNLLWVGTENGIHCFDVEVLKYQEVKLVNSEGKFIKGNVDVVYIEGEDIWFTSSNKLYKGKYNPQNKHLNITSLSHLVSEIPEDLQRARINQIQGNGNGVIWLATSNGVFELSNINGTYRYTNTPESMSEQLEGIGLYSYGIKLWGNILYVCSKVEVIAFMLDGNHSITSILKTIKIKEQLTQLEKRNANLNLRNLVVDDNLDIWCTSNIGLLHIENPLSKPKVEMVLHSDYDQHTISANHVTSLYIDDSDCLWVGTWSGGASVMNLNQKKFNVLTHNPDSEIKSINYNYVRCFAEDDEKNILIGIKGGGIRVFNPVSGELKPLQLKYKGQVHSLLQDIRCMDVGEKFIAVGCTNGLVLIDKKTKQVFEYRHTPENKNISNGPIFSIQVDDKNNVWAGFSTKGINKIVVNSDYSISVKRIMENTLPSLTSNSIVFLRFKSDYNELYASSDKGLNRIILNQDREISDIIHYRLNNSESSFKSEYIWPVVSQDDSTLWVGTLGGGLYKMHLLKQYSTDTIGKYRAELISEEQDVLEDIEILEFDNNGNIWYGGRGLTFVNKRNNTLQRYDEFDGLHGNGFKVGASYVASDGTLYMGGVNGLTYFNPDDIEKNEIQPKTRLVGLYINKRLVQVGDTINQRVVLKKDLPYTSKIVLKHQENDFSIHFSNMHFANPVKGLFKYRLLPYHQEWQFNKAGDNVVNFSNLKYDEYTFQLMSANSDGLWDESVKELNIKIEPPFYLSRIAFAGYFIMLSLIILSIYFYAKRLMNVRQNLRLKEAEEQKREELHQHKLQFFTNISHEFKTPLTLIHSPLEKLYDEEKPEGERKKLFQLVFDNTSRLQRLINELMDFRKTELGKSQLKTQLLNLNELVTDVHKQFLSLSENKNIELKFQANEIPAIWIDKEKVHKIVNNLYSNALKFTEDKGVIKVKTSVGKLQDIDLSFVSMYEERSEFMAEQYVFFEVEDSGVGISKKSVSKVFDRFYHEDHHSDNHLGSGIGLALVKSFTLLHKGCIIVNSERGKGTKFIVAFPCGDMHLTSTQKVVEDNINDLLHETDDMHTLNDVVNIKIENSKPTLLIVEDNSELRNMLMQHFKLNYNVLGAENGMVGFEVAQENVPDMIISDVMMPKMDGIELCKRVREDVAISHIPILLLTAKSSLENQIESAETGADAFMAKPFSMRLLDAKVERTLNHMQVLKERYGQDVFANTRDIVRNNKDREFIDKLVACIEDNMENPEFVVDNLIPELGLGRTKLYQKVKGLTGKSPLEFIRSLRLKEAARILLSEDVSISEVVFRVGLQSSSYFSKAFKAEFNMTPTEFLKSHEKNSEEDNV